MPPKSDRERSTESKLWCIKLLSRDAYLFKGRKKVQQLKNIVGAEVTESSKPSSVSGTSPTAKKTVKVLKNYMKFNFTRSVEMTYCCVYHFGRTGMAANFTDVAKCRVTVTLQNAKLNVQQSNFLIKDIVVNYNLPIKKCQAVKKSVIDLKSNPCRVEVSNEQ